MSGKVAVSEAIKTPTKNNIAPLMTSNSDEWYTPEHICVLVRKVLGEVDLDPCSNQIANATVKAKTFYTKRDNGLARTWSGRVYMNPPYGDVIGEWVDKLVASFGASDVCEAIALLPGRIDTQWFQPLFDFRLCAIRGRLKFSNADSATFPSVAAYMGEHGDRFSEVFGEIGAILERVK